MSLSDGTYLIHSCAENQRNFYTLAGYDGQAVGTVSGGSLENPTEVRNIYLSVSIFTDQTQWQVQKHPSSGTYTITAKGSQGKWTRSQNRTGDEIVIFSSNPTGWSYHWRLVDIDTRTKEPIMGYLSLLAVVAALNLCLY